METVGTPKKKSTYRKNGKRVTVEEEKPTPSGKAQEYLQNINSCLKAHEDWRKRAKAYWRVYSAQSKTPTDSSDRPYGGSKYRILYSNTQTLLPAIFARMGVPQVERVHKDSDPIARISGEVEERAIDVETKSYDLEKITLNGVMDYLITGRGIWRSRYEPEFAETMQPDPETQELTPFNMKVGEKALIEYVHFSDYVHGPGRTEEEITWEAYCAYMTKEQVTERWNEDVANKLAYTFSAEDKQDVNYIKPTDKEAKCKIWEYWNKKTKTVCWVTKESQIPLEEAEDPYKLDGFFPSVRLFGIVSNDSEYLTPTPEYQMYQEQAVTLDSVTNKEAEFVEMLKVVGIYDASAEGLQRVLLEGRNNELIPITSFSRNGNLNNQISWLPLDHIINTIQAVRSEKSEVLNDIYQITGISDIVRGYSDPNETATAQQIKGQYANIRLVNRQKDVYKVVRSMYQKTGELIVEHFTPDYLRALSGYDYMQDRQPEPTPEEVQQLLQQGQQPPPPEWPQIVDFLKNGLLRNFRITVETDSTIALNEQAEKEAATEYLNAVGGFINQALPVISQAPPLISWAKDTLMAVARRYKFGRELESSLETSFESYKESVLNPQPQEPDPAVQLEEQKLQMEGQKLQAEQSKMDAELQLESQKFQYEGQKLQADVQKIRSQVELEKVKAQNEAAKQAGEMRLAEMKAELEMIKIRSQIQLEKLQAQFDSIKLGQEAQKNQLDFAMQRATSATSQPLAEPKKKKGERKIRISRGPDGSLSGETGGEGRKTKKFTVSRDANGKLTGAKILER